MNAKQAEQKAEALAENVWVRLLARAAWPLVAVILSIAGLYWNATLASIDRTAGATLHQVQQLADAERRNSDAILTLQGEIRLGEQKDFEQDRTLERHERMFSDRRRFNWPPRTEEP